MVSSQGSAHTLTLLLSDADQSYLISHHTKYKFKSLKRLEIKTDSPQAQPPMAQVFLDEVHFHQVSHPVLLN